MEPTKGEIHSEEEDFSDLMDPQGLIYSEYLAALDREFFTQFGAADERAGSERGAAPVKQLCEGGPMRRASGGSQSVTQYHPYANPSSVDQYSTQTVPSNPEANPIGQGGITELPRSHSPILPPAVATPDQTYRPIQSHPADPSNLAQQIWSSKSELSRVLFQNIQDSSTAQQVPGSVWLSVDNYQALCAMAGVKTGAASMADFQADNTQQLSGRQQPATGMQARSAQMSNVCQSQLIESQQPMQLLVHQQLHQQPTLQTTRVEQNSADGSLNSILHAQWSDDFRASSQTALPTHLSRSLKETVNYVDHFVLKEAPEFRARSQSTYECIYCGQLKETAASGGPDGNRVRIRCNCGGKRRDRQSRMHTKWRRRQVHPSVEPQVPVPMQVLPSTEPQIPLPQTNSASWTSTPQHLQTARQPNPPSSIMPDAQLESKVSAIYDTQGQPSTTMLNARSDVLEFLLDESNNQMPASRNSDNGIIQWPAPRNIE